MEKKKELGIYQSKTGYWFYRYTITIDGKKQEVRASKDEFGNPFRTKKDAIRARDESRKKAKTERTQLPVVERRYLKEVYAEYCEKGRYGKAYTTIRKQNSLWDNHLSARFGNRLVDDISVAEIQDYLSELYFVNGYSYRYVEGFLKMFYLFFGQAYSRNYISVDTYNKLCVNKDTKIRMPKMKVDDEMDVVVFTKEEMAQLDEYFSGTNAETAYLLGKYCGLRINECFGLKWNNVNFDASQIVIDRQMQYQEGLIKLVPVKTRNGKRIVFMNEKLKVHLQKQWAREQENRIQMARIRAQKQRFIDDIDGTAISSTELVNCLADGTIQTVNSFKYPTRELREKHGIAFKYHYLRHTFGTAMAEVNTPQHLLKKIMGHGNINVTQQYYLAMSATGEETLKDKLNQI